jgi:transposase
MAQRRTPMKKIREIVRLHEKCGLSLRKTAQALNLSRPVTNDYYSKCHRHGLTYEIIKDMPDDELLKVLQTETVDVIDVRYKRIADSFEYFARELKRVGVTRHLLWEEYRRKDPDGYGYSQFCYHFQMWENSQEISMHMEHKAGDKLFVDFAGKKLAITDRRTGAIRPVEVFVAILGASNLTYVEAAMTQQKHDFIKVNVNTLHYLGGVPRAIVPDCLKSGVTKGDKYEPEINPEYLDFAHHYGTTILPARPHKPRDKALVEGAVKIVYSWIYARLRDRVFYSLEELNRAIRVELEHYNGRKMQRYGQSRCELFDEIEKTVLMPLPAQAYEIREYKRLKAQFNYHVYLSVDKHYYSVPHRYRGKQIDVLFTASTVELYHNNVRIAFYKRNRSKYGYTTVPEHMPPNHRWRDDWNAGKLISWGESIGDEVKLVVETVLSSRQHPEQGYKTCLGILNLAKSFGNARLVKACRRAIDYEQYSYRMIKNILQNNMDIRSEDPALFDTAVPLHENIRGRDYYTQEEI